jgi:3-phosphoshikimate 1-carboxyvinyltransferase
LLALPLLKENSALAIEGETVSKGYIDITLSVLKDFGVHIEQNGSEYAINGSQGYKTKGKIVTEGDWSNAAFWLAAGVINGDITLTGLNPLSPQGDREILSILKGFGGNITATGDSVRAQKSRLHGQIIDARDIPDLAPVLSVAAAAAEGVTEIRNAERLRLKESDRLDAVLRMLNGLGVRARYDDGALYIYGGKITGGEVNGFNDHRMVMSAAVAAAAASAPVTVTDSQAVSKSYPAFFEDYKRLGGIVS